MTGFGSREGTCGGIVYRIEIRSVNHRYCDINMRIPDELLRLEPKIRSAISRKFSRGKFEVSVSEIDPFIRDARPVLKISTIKQYQSILKELSLLFHIDFNIRNDVGLSDMLALKEMVTLAKSGYDTPEIEKPFLKILDQSLEGLKKMRSKEGNILYRDIKQRVRRIESLLGRIGRHLPKVTRDLRKRYMGRIKDLSNIPQLDRDRLYQELAILMERMDVTEEIVRVRSHVTQIKNRLVEGGVVGRTLDFLLQEIHREINTIASKASDMKISQVVVDMKAEVERIREQVQNIE